MEKIVLYTVALFFVIGAIDYIEGNKLNLGKAFENGIKTMGPLSISMIGILSLIPFFTGVLNKFLVPIAERLSLDASIISGSLIATDMGGFNLSMELAKSINIGNLSGILMSSTLGATISFTLPLAIGLVSKKNIEVLFKGILCGIVALPIGLFIGGLMLGIPFRILIWNLIPVILIAIILAAGMFLMPSPTVFIFQLIGKIITFISILGLIIQGIKSICGITFFDNLMPLESVLVIVGRIAIFIGGAYVLIEIIKIVLNKILKKISGKFKINANLVTLLIGSLASAIVIFDNYDDLDRKGKLLCAAFSVAGSYAFGGQMGYVSSVAPSLLITYITVKLLCGAIAIGFALLFLNYESKLEQGGNYEK